VEQRPDGLVRITLKRAYTDGTIAVDMDPLSPLCRLATSVPPPRLHTLRYAGVLAAASPWRSRLAPQSPQAAAASNKPGRPDHADREQLPDVSRQSLRREAPHTRGQGGKATRRVRSHQVETWPRLMARAARTCSRRFDTYVTLIMPYDASRRRSYRNGPEC